MKREKLPSEKAGYISDGKEPFFDSNLVIDLSKLLNQDPREIIEDCYCYEAKKFMGRIGQINVRFDLPQGKLEKLLCNAEEMEMADVLIPPLYLANCKKISNKLNINRNYSVIVDFPFGESVFDVKKNAVKDCIRQGAKSITVTLPNVLMLPERLKEYKKQTKKIGVMADIPIGVALNGQDMTEEQIKTAIKIADKTRVDFITFFFGDSSGSDIVKKMQFIKKLSDKKVINVLANIDSADVVSELLKISINTIYTPFADEIAKQVKDRFNLKKINLL